MTTGVANGGDEDSLAANKICHVKWETWKIDPSKSARPLSPEQWLPRHGVAHANASQARNSLFVISRGFLDLNRRLWQEIQSCAH
jgi:hypothetical protein